MKAAFLAASALFGAAGLAVLWLQPAPGGAAIVRADPLGDLSAYEAIVADTRGIAATGDLAAAGRRITDLETAWDEAEPTLRPTDPTAWGDVDEAADAAFAALRARQPDPAQVEAALVTLADTLAHPVSGPAGDSAILRADGTVATTDAAGRPLPCEDMAAELRARLGDAAPTPAVADLRARGLERCNADDDARADAFFAQALGLVLQP